MGAWERGLEMGGLVVLGDTTFLISIPIPSIFVLVLIDTDTDTNTSIPFRNLYLANLGISKSLLRDSNIFTLAGLRHVLLLQISFPCSLRKPSVQMQQMLKECKDTSRSHGNAAVSGIERYSILPSRNLVSAVSIPGTGQHYGLGFQQSPLTTCNCL